MNRSTPQSSAGFLVHLFHTVLLTAIFCHPHTDAQTDPFPLVNVNDSNADITSTTEKIYIFTVALLPASTSTNDFIAQTFIDSASPYYGSGAGLRGYVVMSVVETATSGNNLLVTYHVRYNYQTLLATPEISNQMISDTIGNYGELIQAFDGTDLTNFYVLPRSDDLFSFTGTSLCSVATCSTNTQCTETLAGITVECKSPCKLGYCNNNGTCAQENANTSPTCTCLSKADVWFLGERCQTMVALWMVILVVVGCALLIIAAIVIACCCYAAKRRKKEKESELFGVEDVHAYTNKAYLSNETNKPEVETITKNGFQEREVGLTTIDSAHPRSRSRTPSSEQYTQRRRHRSRSSSYRRHHSRSRRHQRHYRRHRSSRSSSSDRSYDHHQSSDESSDVSQEDVHTTSAFPQSSLPRQSSFSSSMSSETPVKGKPSNTSKESTSVSTSVRDQGVSPIRWVSTNQSPRPMPGNALGKIDISARKGWMPSLGPQMFDLAASQENLNYEQILPSNAHLAMEASSYMADTDI